MSKGIRNLVSRKKRRFKEDGFDLDLSYITERLIAMGFPAQKFEGVYRNHIDEVCRFLEDRHKDHYRIYNLCSEKNRSYDEARFHNRVRNFPFADHNPPPLIDIEPLCKDMGDWLTEDQKNVAVVHCKAGKGRTGVMICCYLLHCRSKILAQEALDFYGDKRTFDRKGVTIPSQRRYVHYYGQLVSTNFNYNPPYVRLREAKMNAPLSSVNSEVYLVISSHLNKKGYSSQSGDIRKGKEWIHLPVKDEVARPMSGDIKIELKRTNFVRRTEKLFSAWLNTHFIFEEGKKVTNGCDINASDQNNHNTPNIRQRSNSFRVAKHDSFVRKRCETTAEPRAPPTGLGGGSSGGAGASDGYYRETRKKKLSQSGCKSLPTTTTSHLTCLTDDGWGSSIDGSRSPRHTRCHTRHRRRHHTQNLPMCGTARDSWDSEARAGEQEVQVILTKNELDKASKDTHNKLLPEDFRIELWWLVTYVNKGGSNALESRESGSTPSTITPSGSSSDEDEDEDDDEEEEGSDWDSAEGSEVLL